MSLPSHDQGAWNIWAIMMFGFAGLSIVFELFLPSRTLLNRPLKKRMLSYSFSFGKFASVNSSQRDFIIAQAWYCDQSSTQYAKYYTSAKARTHGQIEFSQFTLYVHHLQ
jgi:hypothetical protein